MSKEYQNMDPNTATPSSSLDEDQNKFRARFERLATFSLAYDPSLLQASPDSSSTVSRSPLQLSKIRTDWSRPDLDDDQDRDLKSSGLCTFSLANLEDSRISSDSSPECDLAELNFTEPSSILKELRDESLPSSPVIAPVPTDSNELRRDSGSGLSAILHTSSDNESDMEMSSTCGAILLDRTEGEANPSPPRYEPVCATSGESTMSELEPSSQSDLSAASDGKESEGLYRELSLDNTIATLALSLPQCEPSPIIAPRKCESDCLMTSDHRAKLSESESENIVDYINTTPIKKPVGSRSSEGIPVRVLFPEHKRSVEGTPLKATAVVSRNASVSSSFNVEGTPSRRNRAIDQVQSEIPELVVRLNSKHDDWTRRIEALKRVSKFCTFHMSVTTLSEAIQPLLDPLALQLQDLRSQIVKQACITIGDLAVCLGVQFQAFARRLLPRLLDLLRIAKKVMSSAGDDCLRRIITHSHSDAIDIIINESVSNKSPIVRCRCLEYALLALQTWAAGQLILYKLSIGSLFSKVCSDSTKDVRTAGKRLFYEYSQIWPDDSRALFQALDQKLQKGILTDFPDLHSVVSISDEEFTAADASNCQKTPSRLSLAEIKANLRRESLSNAPADADIIFVEKSPVPAPKHFGDPLSAPNLEAPKTPTKSFTIKSDELKLGMLPSSNPSLSFKFDQSYPSVHLDRDRLALSPIPVEFLEGFPVPAPLRASIPPDGRPVMPEPSPLVKHSSRRFTSRIFGTPINGKFDESGNDDDDSSSSTSTCPTVDQSFDEADDNGQMSVTSSIAAESLDVLSRDAAPVESPEFDPTDQSTEKMLMLASKLQYLRTMATSVFDECDSPVRTIEIHHDLTTSALDTTTQGHGNEDAVTISEPDGQKRDPALLPEAVETRVRTPQRELTCDLTLKVGNYSFEASKSPKDVLNAVLSSPPSEHIFKSPDSTPIPTPSRQTSLSKPLKTDDDSSTLRSILFILLSMIMFAILLHGLPDFLRPGSDELISHSKLQYSQTVPKLEHSHEPVQKVYIPIRDTGEVIFVSSDDIEESASELHHDFDSDSGEGDSETLESDSLSPGLHVQSQDQAEDDSRSENDITHSAAFSSELHAIHSVGEVVQPEPTHAADEPNSDSAADVTPSVGHPLSLEVAADAVDSADNATAVEHPLSLEGPADAADSSDKATAFKFEILDSLNIEGNATGVVFDRSSPNAAVSLENPVDSTSDEVKKEERTESSQSKDGSQDGWKFTPKVAYLYSLGVAVFCWVTYRLRSIPVRADIIGRDPDFDLTGVTMAPEWDIDLDSVLPSGPSPLPHPGGSDFQRWSHIKRDGTTMTLFSPLRRTLRIRRPTRTTQY